MNSTPRVTMVLAALVLALLLAVYGVGYYVCIHRHYETFAAGVDFLYADDATSTLFRPAIWLYEKATGREVMLNPLVDPAPELRSSVRP
jgi:hypothetical protein